MEPWSELRHGAHSPAVEGMQHLLRAHGRDVKPDGQFGRLTEAAVKAFQVAAGLPEDDGTVGPVTWRALVIPTRRGSNGEPVKGVQSFGLVFRDGLEPLAVDGIFGAETEGRVVTFQNLWGLTADGIAGRETWSFLGAEGEVWPLVKPGSRAPANSLVRPVQYLLRARGAAIQADGIYGPRTAEAVRQFQMGRRAQYIGDTVGQLDWPNLVVTVRRGDSGDAVRAVQDLLGIPQNGEFGPHTETAVKDFQEMFGLTADGVVGHMTWHSLVVPKSE